MGTSGVPWGGHGPAATLIPGPVTLHLPRPCLRGALGLERGCISLSPVNPEDHCILLKDAVSWVEAPPRPSVRPHVGLRTTEHPLCLLLGGHSQTSCLPGAFQGKLRCLFQARGLGMGDGLSKVPGSDRRSSGKMDGSCGIPRHRGTGGTEPMLLAPMNVSLRGRMGTIILSCYTSVAPTGL